MKKSRLIFMHPEANPGKVEALEALYVEYQAYLRTCIESMLQGHRTSLVLSELQTFFSPSEILSSQIVKNARAHAVGIVSGWAASLYERKLRNHIGKLFREGVVNEDLRKQLYIVGKRGVDKPGLRVSQEALDFYWAFLLDTEVSGKPPTVSDRVGMRLSEMTAVLATSEDTKLTVWWLGFSHLEAGKRRIQIPLVANPYVSSVDDVSKGILARKNSNGRWSFQVVERKEWEIPITLENAPRVAVDVGLNVAAATSDGRLYGQGVKPRFNRLYEKIRSIRANRQRQGLREDSPRLIKLESRLSGLTKSMAGRVSNQLVKAYPDHVFVLEDLDLRGCRGQKRFAYKAVATALERKAPTTRVNPAYTSQTCPSCGFISRSNRKGTLFVCKQCGRRSHADVVGGINLLGRSEEKQIHLDDHPSVVRGVLETRHRAWRKRQVPSRAPSHLTYALAPSSQRLTTRHVAGTASNQVAL